MIRTARYWIPLVAGFGCLFAALHVGPVLTIVLLVAGLGLLLDAGTAMFAKAGGTGGMFDNRQ
jgi:hypothetical protein